MPVKVWKLTDVLQSVAPRAVRMPATFGLSRMVRQCVVGAFVIASLAVSHGRATAAAEADVPASPSAGVADRAAAPNSSLSGPQVNPSGKQVTRRCCSLKGALIGGGIGAAGGFFVVRYTCDSYSCTSSYFKAMGVLGGLGAGIGAYTARPSIVSPIRPLAGSSVTVQPVISRLMIGGGVGITF